MFRRLEHVECFPVAACVLKDRTMESLISPDTVEVRRPFRSWLQINHYVDDRKSCHIDLVAGVSPWYFIPNLHILIGGKVPSLLPGCYPVANKNLRKTC